MTLLTCMSIPPMFEHDLPEAFLHLEVHQLLLKLSSLDHVLYLQNNVSPCIFLAAENYCVIQNNQINQYRVQHFNHYVKLQNTYTVADVFSQLKNESNNMLAGFISYDFAAQQQVDISAKLQPSLFIGNFPHILKKTEQGWTFFSHHPSGEAIFQAFIQLLTAADTQPVNEFKLAEKLRPRWSKENYAVAFHQVQEYIQAGDCYQINLTQEFHGQAAGELLHTAEKLWQLTAAPYSSYLRVANFELLSCSPELFIDFENQRKIVTKPIKGTMPRSLDPEQDLASKLSLVHSEKDRAENVMIVDLLRNDLSVYAETGSVKTPKLFHIESFNQVHHMVSEVEAILKPEVNPFDMLISALPGGSITGAPKIRAMQIIDELEQAPRGAYCGSMGYFNADGTGSWNILIRTIQKYRDEVSVWAGGGITIASQCDAEYQECFDKVNAILELLNTWHTPK